MERHPLYTSLVAYKDNLLSHPCKNSAKLIGEKFGKLLVSKRLGINKERKSVWECYCECGNSITATTYMLRSSKTQSCGCLRKEMLTKRNLKHGQSIAGNHSPEFTTWRNIKSRCYNKNDYRYKDYGGRGIAICDKWLNDFESFFADMGKRPSNKHSIDRENNNGNYEPSNCRWATTEQQQRNKRNNVWIEYSGDTKTLTDWANHLKCTPSNILYFLKSGKSFDYIYNHYKKLYDTKEIA